MNSFMNLNNPKYSYMLGFIQCDGHLSQETRNRGKCSIELNVKDSDILFAFSKITPFKSTISYRIRDTNFKKKSETIIWSLYNQNARARLQDVGMIVGKKSDIIKPPTTSYCERDYIRGLIDADGSIGIDRKSVPFISFTSKSEYLIAAVVKYIKEITKYKFNPSRNERDNIFVLTCYSEKAQQVINHLYYEKCLCLKRKYKLAQLAMKWKRPSKITCT